MAWNPSPEVAAARDAASKLNAGAAIILYWTGKGHVGMASYGKNTKCCKVAGLIGDELFDHIIKQSEDELSRPSVLDRLINDAT